MKTDMKCACTTIILIRIDVIVASFPPVHSFRSAKGSFRIVILEKGYNVRKGKRMDIIRGLSLNVEAGIERVKYV